MRLVERIARKTFHIRKDLFRRLFRYPPCDGSFNVAPVLDVSVNEFVFLRHQFGFVLFAHGAADEVCCPSENPARSWKICMTCS